MRTAKFSGGRKPVVGQLCGSRGQIRQSVDQSVSQSVIHEWWMRYDCIKRHDYTSCVHGQGVTVCLR